MKVDNVKVVAAFKKEQAKARKDHGASVIVGYNAAYAIFVHEMRQNRHAVGRAGFLLDVAREIRSTLVQVIAGAYRKTRDLAQSLLIGGLRLQRESQKNCPVDTGALRGSAFTRKE